MKYITTINNRDYTVEIINEKQVSIDGKLMDVDFVALTGQPVYSLIIDGKSHEAYIYEEDNQIQVQLRGFQYNADVIDEREKRLRDNSDSGLGSGEYVLKAPMPGLVISVPVREGDPVIKGQVLIILESMKMQNELKAPRDGVITRIKVEQGHTVEQKQQLVMLGI
ncbi:MAG TPA: biotin/lipoyl-containing protein [Anaerolineales bacterium]|nr:biotin/lipoyl-containing protein [Anaerolineales bacterium]